MVWVGDEDEDSAGEDGFEETVQRHALEAEEDKGSQNGLSSNADLVQSV
jgi:hypothetical protein